MYKESESYHKVLHYNTVQFIVSHINDMQKH